MHQSVTGRSTSAKHFCDLCNLPAIFFLVANRLLSGCNVSLSRGLVISLNPNGKLELSLTEKSEFLTCNVNAINCSLTERFHLIKLAFET